MKLCFLRHATATPNAPTDAERPLTNAGRREARAAAIALQKLGVQPDAILTSPLLRALQTAQIVAHTLKRPDDIPQLKELHYDASNASFFRALKPYQQTNTLLLVGHSPSMPRQIAALIGAPSAQSIALGKAGLACLQVENLQPRGAQLRWLLRPKQIALLAGESV